MLGNISQTIVPVPLFFLEKDEKNLETFHIPKNTRSNIYYTDAKVMNSMIDINFNRNPRFSIKTSEDKNREKYIPIYNRKKYKSNSEFKGTYFPNIIDNSKTRTEYPKTDYEKYIDYKNKTDYLEFFQPKLRQEIFETTNNLLDRINANYDMDRWNKFDHNTQFHKFFQTAYSPITDVINSEGNVRDKFSQTLRDKALSLRSVSPKTKYSIIERVENKIINDRNLLNENNLNNINTNQFIDLMLEENKTNLLNLRNTNVEPIHYNLTDTNFIEENKWITKNINKGDLYKDFPSKTRMEFNEKKLIPKRKFKIVNTNLVSKEKYGFKKEEDRINKDDLWKRPLHNDAYVLD